MMILPMRLTLVPLALAACALSSPALAQSAVTSFGLGATDASSTALNMRWHSAPRPAGWSWAAGLQATDRGAAWIGAGVSYTLRPTGGSLFLRGSVMPGLYRAGNDIDLGGPFEIASAIELGTDLRNGAQLSLLLEHRSNAGIYAANPGVNTLSIAYSIALH